MINTPLWILKSIEYKKEKIAMVMVELPAKPIFNFIESSGEFNEVIVNQLVSVLMNMHKKYQGVPHTLINATKMDEVIEWEDETIMIIHFQKHYKGSTQNVIFGPDEKKEKTVKDLIKKNEHEINKFFLDGTVIKKAKLTLSTRDNFILFLLGEKTTEIKEEDVKKLKSKLYLE